jgi:hypothetical protein
MHCLISSQSSPNKHCNVHFVHGENQTHLDSKHIPVNDWSHITQLESSRAGTGILNLWNIFLLPFYSANLLQEK